ncbi:hypothetical protein Vadar_029847 [Vaccinium darrowii]|uniref:Uncharacterized protein n=1 Tax=Vaccinium darrowii TaxID=229202 RepID=A0ACB7XU98_9ERIC|nr:hypothetical protein Vadar_029847 [Vaccinium darrowii]
MRKQSSPFPFTSFSKMVIKSYLKLQGKDDYRWKFDKLGGGIFSLIRYMPLVVQVCQLPSFAIAGIQHHSTMISLYNAPIMLKITFFRFTKQSIGFKFNHRIRIQQWSCTEKDIIISQSRENTSGIPQFTVQIVNTCVSGCAPSDLHLHCGWFASATLVNPKIFRRLAYDDCLVNEGKPLKTSHIIRFTYATSFMYPHGFNSNRMVVMAAIGVLVLVVGWLVLAVEVGIDGANGHALFKILPGKRM